MRYGNLDIEPLSEGRFSVGLDKVFVPHEDDTPPPKNTLFISVSPFLVRTPNDVILLDTGLGEWAEGRGTEVLLNNLTAHSVAAENITKVLLSHLHFDHAGGAITTVQGKARPTFPRADYVVQEETREAAGYSGESARARDLVWDTLEAAGRMETVDGNGFLTDEIEYVRTDGHCEGHQIFRLHSDDRIAIFGGDVLPEPGQATRRFVAKYDFDGEKSQAWRDSLVREAAENEHLLLFYHSPKETTAYIGGSRERGYRVRVADAA